MFNHSTVAGMDIDKEIVDYGNKVIEQASITNCNLFYGDWYNLDSKWNNQFDGIISFQTLSWLSEYREALTQLVKLNPKWIAISSLFYEGEIEYTIKLKDYYRLNEESEYEEYYYNIYSISRVCQCFKELGYSKFEYMPFEIDIDLPKPENFDIGTYTIRTEAGKRLQISAAMLMPWYFIVASK